MQDRRPSWAGCAASRSSSSRAEPSRPSCARACRARVDRRQRDLRRPHPPAAGRAVRLTPASTVETTRDAVGRAAARHLASSRPFCTGGVGSCAFHGSGGGGPAAGRRAVNSSGDSPTAAADPQRGCVQLRRSACAGCDPGPTPRPGSCPALSRRPHGHAADHAPRPVPGLRSVDARERVLQSCHRGAGSRHPSAVALGGRVSARDSRAASRAAARPRRPRPRRGPRARPVRHRRRSARVPPGPGVVRTGHDSDASRADRHGRRPRPTAASARDDDGTRRMPCSGGGGAAGASRSRRR